MSVHNKLVRDNVPELIPKNGHKVVYHMAGDAEYRIKLRDKLIEECYEFVANEKIEQLADVMEVVHALMKFHGFSYEDVDTAIRSKREERGGFEKRVILEKS